MKVIIKSYNSTVRFSKFTFIIKIYKEFVGFLCSWRSIPNLLWGRLGPKAVRSPKYMNETNFFLQPKCKLGLWRVLFCKYHFLNGLYESGSATVGSFPQIDLNMGIECTSSSLACPWI